MIPTQSLDCCSFETVKDYAHTHTQTLQRHCLQHVLAARLLKSPDNLNNLNFDICDRPKNR